LLDFSAWLDSQDDSNCCAKAYQGMEIEPGGSVRTPDSCLVAVDDTDQRDVSKDL